LAGAGGEGAAGRGLLVLDYRVPSSAAWRVVVRQLERWLEQMKEDSGGH
jgi:hypothetical protein